MSKGTFLFVLSLAAAAPAVAGEPRELCPDRPGLGTPACTVAPGEVVGELGLGDWIRTDTSELRADTVRIGDALLRIGLTQSLEGQVGWSAFGRFRERDKVTGAVSEDSGIGDVMLALRQNLSSPDGSGFSLAIMPYASLPAGGAAIGAGDWGGGLLVPFSFDLGDDLSLAFTPQLDAAVDEDGDGRHLAFGTVVGLGFPISGELSATVEGSLYRDRDPDRHSTKALAGLSAGWQPDEGTQFDIGVNLGLNHASPDGEVYAGITRRF